jgi:hypothetical protein
MWDEPAAISLFQRSCPWNLLSVVVSGSGLDSVVSIVTRCGLDRPEIEFRWRWDFRACLDRPWDPPDLLYNWHRVFLGGKAVGWFCWPQTPLWRRGCEWVCAIYLAPLCACVDMTWVTFTFTVCLEIAFHLVSSALHTVWGRRSRGGNDKFLSSSLRMKAADSSETFVHFYHYIWLKLNMLSPNRFFQRPLAFLPHETHYHTPGKCCEIRCPHRLWTIFCSVLLSTGRYTALHS